MLGERWIARIKEHLGQRGYTPTSPDVFDNQLDTTLVNFAAIAINKSTINTNRDYVINELRSELKDNKNEEIKQLRKTYTLAFQEYTTITDTLKMESRADLAEKFRFLMFRLLTAIGIAGVVLLTGLIAQHFDIPLPLLRSL